MTIYGGMTAQAAVPIGTVVLTVDERDDGVVDFGFGNVAFHGVLAPDPGPAGLQSALTFGLVGLSFPYCPDAHRARLPHARFIVDRWPVCSAAGADGAWPARRRRRI
jgi:hypothetical protein